MTNLVSCKSGDDLIRNYWLAGTIHIYVVWFGVIFVTYIYSILTKHSAHTSICGKLFLTLILLEVTYCNSNSDLLKNPLCVRIFSICRKSNKITFYYFQVQVKIYFSKELSTRNLFLKRAIETLNIVK